MGTIGFCISLLALSVSFASSQECIFKRNSKVLEVNCSQLLQISFTVPQIPPYLAQNFERISADYQYNKLQTISKFSFARLRSLNLANNKINFIGDGAFSGVELHELNLSFNKINSISRKQLTGLKELRTLSLYGNMISQLDPDVFSSMVLLENLDLGHNFIAGQIDPVLFRPLTALKSLLLQENVISDVHTNTFLSQKYLEKLSLAENAIERLDSSSFESLWNLVSLDLSHNRFVGLDDTIFKSQQEIEFLDLSWNSLEYFGEKLGLSPSLKVIKLGHNSLEDVKISGKLKKLKEIYVENNRLSSLQFLKSYDMLEVVNASSNNLSTIEEGSYQFLRTLDLSNNSFTTIPTLITAKILPSLTHLHMDMNPIPSVKFPLSGESFKFLKLVSLSRMPLLKEVSRDSFSALRKSGSRQRRSDDYMEEEEEEDYETDHTVDTTTQEKEETETQNEMTDFPKTEVNDEETGKHETSSVSYTDTDSQGTIQEEESNDSVPDGMMKTAKLRAEPDLQEVEKKVFDDCSLGGITLDISHNENLANIEDDAFADIDICMLDLSNNALTSVPKNMARWDDLPSVDFQGNPWDCSCSLQWLLDTIVAKLYPSQEKQHLLYELRCASPMTLRGLRFVHFYNWTEEAFCATHQLIKKAPTSDDNATGVTLQLGGSTGMFVGVGIAIGMVALLVGVAAWLHKSNMQKKRARNRRV